MVVPPTTYFLAYKKDILYRNWEGFGGIQNKFTVQSKCVVVEHFFHAAKS